MLLGLRVGVLASVLLAATALPSSTEVARADDLPGPWSQANPVYDGLGSAKLARASIRVQLESTDVGDPTSPGTRTTGFNVRVSLSPMLASAPSPWRYPAELQGVPPTNMSSTNAYTATAVVTIGGVGQGQHLCVATQARNGRGELGPWSNTRCITRFADQGVLEKLGRRKVVRDKRYWGGTAISVLPGGRLRLAGVPAGTLISVLESPGVGFRSPWKQERNASVVVAGPGARGRVRIGESCVGHNTRDPFRRICMPWRPTARKGPVILRASVSQRKSATIPIDGILVEPSWTRPPL